MLESEGVWLSLRYLPKIRSGLACACERVGSLASDRRGSLGSLRVAVDSIGLVRKDKTDTIVNATYASR